MIRLRIPLSSRQQETIDYLFGGRSIPETARLMGIGVHGVRACLADAAVKMEGLESMSATARCLAWRSLSWAIQQYRLGLLDEFGRPVRSPAPLSGVPS